MRKTAASLAAALLCAALSLPCMAGESEDAAARLEKQAGDFLEGLVGPGRSRVFVTVEGEVSEVRTQSEVVTPIRKPEDMANEKLPGYAALTGQPGDLQFLQKDVESSSRRPAFNVRRINVSVVLDSSVPDALANDVRRLLPDLLRLKAERDDDLSVLRADLLPPWKAMAYTPDGIRLGLQVGAALVCVLFLAFAFYGTALRVTRTFVSEVAALRSQPAQETAVAVRAVGAQPLDVEGEIMPGSAPTLAELGFAPAAGGGGAAPALGRRFDFLTARPSDEAARLLSDETPEDLSLLFCHLSDTSPEVAGRLFESMPSPRQALVAGALARLTQADPRKVEELEDRLRARFESGVEGSRKLGSLLSRVPPETREEVLGGLFTGDPDAAREVERAVTPFEAIFPLERRDLRRLISAVPQEVWGVALRSAPAEFTQKVLAELPAASRAALTAVLEQPQPKNKVLEARSRILAEASALASRGLIALGEAGAAELL